MRDQLGRNLSGVRVQIEHTAGIQCMEQLQMIPPENRKLPPCKASFAESLCVQIVYMEFFSVRAGSLPVCLAASAIFGGSIGASEIVRGIDQRNVAECLWKIAEEAFFSWVVFLR